MRLGGVGAAALVLLSCGGGEPGETAGGVERLRPVEHLVRASMAVRGHRPSLDEIRAVQADPQALPGLVDGWLAGEPFGATIRDLHAELWLLRDDTNYQLPVKGPLLDLGLNQQDLHVATVEAPLRMVEEIVLADRPYTELLTADYTVANDVVAAVYGLPYDPDGPEWQHTVWTDGRPQSGVLSDSQLWRRHTSNAANYHRGRANFVSRTFLCEDIGARDVFVAGGVNVADDDAVALEVSTNEGCVACHNALDPLAAFFWGYKEQLQRGAILTAYDVDCEWDWSKGDPTLGDGAYRVEHWCYPLRFWDVTEQDGWVDKGLRPPALYGRPGDDLGDLGRLVVEDPRFPTCTVRNVAGYLTETPRDELPDAWADELARGFVEGGYSVRALVREIVLSDAFAAARGETWVAGLQTIRPEQLSRTIEDLTGFVWFANQDAGDCGAINGNECWGAVDVLTTDVHGFRSMMGGIDGYTVTTPVHSPTPTQLLALGEVADEAAGYVVANDLGQPAAARRLLGAIEAADTDPAKVRAQIALLFLRVTGEDVDPYGPDASLAYALWDGAFGRTGDSREAWRVVISALLQDPRMVLY